MNIKKGLGVVGVVAIAVVAYFGGTYMGAEGVRGANPNKITLDTPITRADVSTVSILKVTPIVSVDPTTLVATLDRLSVVYDLGGVQHKAVLLKTDLNGLTLTTNLSTALSGHLKAMMNAKGIILTNFRP